MEKKDVVKNIMKIKFYKRPGNKKKLVDKIIGIIKELTGNYFTKDVMENAPFDLYYQDLVVLYINGQIESFIIFTCIDGYITITLIATRYKNRNKGYGTILYKYFEKEMIKNGFKHFLVQTVPEEANANFHDTIEFYKKQGYKINKLYKELWENGALELIKEI
jgi:ribosomal protein S18 acetylase RimI-like enzyme